ncbi:MAG: YlxR family protein [Chloroflexi bacterium]|nr:YlxR family protein [Chloroflexota bacterium]
MSQHTDRPRPQRTCAACRRVSTKGELIRLRRVADGNIEIDFGHKGTGRGAYLCRARECWEIALKSGRLEHSLRTVIEKDQRQQLMRMAEERLFSQTS